jgi:hypothetical protein
MADPIRSIEDLITAVRADSNVRVIFANVIPLPGDGRRSLEGSELNDYRASER